MLKKTAVAFLFCLTSTIANANPVEMAKDVLCYSTPKLLELLSKNHSEKPIWLADSVGDDDSRYTILVNPKTNDWTLLQFNATVACVLGHGKNSKLILLPENSI